MKDIMLDLETMGTGHRAAIVSIGAVVFDRKTFEMGLEFYVNVDLEDSGAYFNMDPATVSWWLQQSDEARLGLLRPKPLSVLDALHAFALWLPKDACVWGNGCGFDNRILRDAYQGMSLNCPFHYTKDRDLRTFMDMYPKIPKLDRSGTHHNALDDAKFQVECMKVATWESR